jgi:hypothetical protein
MPPSPSRRPLDNPLTLYYKVSMTTMKRTVAVVEWLLIFPAALFMAALFVRNLQPVPYEPAETARRIVDWFSARPRLGLQVFLMALPLLAFFLGGTAVMRYWRNDPQLRLAAREMAITAWRHLAALLIAGATLLAGAILAVVALHVLTD